MGKHHKTWSQEEKLAIVNFYKEHGPGKTSREFSVSTASIHKWVEAFNGLGSSGLEKGALSDKDKIILQLKRENQAFKEIIAEKELALRIQESLLKKKTHQMSSDSK